MAEKNAEPPKARADEITIEVAGRLLMVTAERVRQLIKSGHIEKTRHGYTTIPSAVQGYIKFLKESASERTTNAALTRAQDARAREVELRIAKEMRDLIHRESVEHVMSRLAAEIILELNGQAARVTRDMALRRILEADVHGIKERIAKVFERSQRDIRTGKSAL